MADATKIKLGPCDVTLYHPTLGTLALGHTIGGAIATYTPEYYESKVDKYGSSVVKQFLVGEVWMAEFSLAEWTLPNLKAAIAAHTAQADDSVSIGRQVGFDTSGVLGLLVLHPQDMGSSRDFDFGIYRAASVGELKIENKSDGERLLPCTFNGVIDETRANGDLLGFIGDSIA